MKKVKGLAIILIAVVIGAGAVIAVQSIKSNQEASVFAISNAAKTSSLVSATASSSNPAQTAVANSAPISTRSVVANSNPAPDQSGIPAHHITPRPWSLCPPTATIAVTKPNGGETYALAGQYSVTWTTCNISSMVIPTISLVYAPTNTVIQTLTVNHDAQYGWTNFILPNTLPSQYALGDNFKIKLTETVNGQAVSDESDNNFTIDSEVVSANGVSSGSYNGGIATFTIPFLVKAEGAAIYVPKTVSSGNPNGGGCSPNSANVMFCVFGIAGANFTLGGGVLTQVGNVATLTSNGNYKIPIGQSASFVLKVTINSLQHGDYDAFLTLVPWSLSDIPASNGYGNNPLTQFCILPIEPNLNSNLLNASVRVP